jgi:hypothetical protein
MRLVNTSYIVKRAVRLDAVMYTITATGLHALNHGPIEGE